ncbi:selenocysteine-specific translation elongation factor [Filobacillus milosensis]|uniref:Selenocysteine-specific elongation factor n=1 Tax=Filobacillus milosensis TaxID=94137 RepID=A0A4Y8ISJ6_9BACI|nr:selenocysteine-specific translation elongation factor [Filobacillus milosensis]TFB23110.1 selenocysteine-specific translation elongation factor [Filobacillus milosensis]
MNKHNFTIGMAGHIDHGKTELVKALTGVETDRLKEEKERKISIELGYAPLFQNDDMSVSIIDVPGHERFIRQMIAGVSSIDLTLLVIAADEGVMPQTIEHLEILNHLDIQNGLIVITKIRLADPDLLAVVREEIGDLVKGTVFEGKSIFEVDSINGEGIEQLKTTIQDLLKNITPKPSNGALFFPIDQSFHIHGIGTVVRGTIVEGMVKAQEELIILPSQKKVQVKSIQQFNEPVQAAYAGQRAAIALKGIDANEINRGSVVTNNHHAEITNRVDIELNISPHLTTVVKQRTPIKLHTGTNEVYGKIIFYDRNKLENNEDIIYAQLVLDQTIFVIKDQRFILRRATPIETIGGGRIIDPYAEKHKHGEETVVNLKQKAAFDEKDYILSIINNQPGIKLDELIRLLNYTPELEKLIKEHYLVIIDQRLFSVSLINQIKTTINQYLSEFHLKHPLLLGMNKSELTSKLPLSNESNWIIVEDLISGKEIIQTQNFLALPDFKVELSNGEEQTLSLLLSDLKSDGLKVKEISSYLKHHSLNNKEDFLIYLLQHEYIHHLQGELYIETNAFKHLIEQLYKKTGASFSLKEAKDILDVSRKYLIPFLEKLDKLNITKRVENQRYWVNK